MKNKTNKKEECFAPVPEKRLQKYSERFLKIYSEGSTYPVIFNLGFHAGFKKAWRSFEDALIRLNNENKK